MPSARDFLFGYWRAVPVLGVTQIIGWGALIYPPVLTVPLIAAEKGWSIAFSMSGFSLGLLAAGLVAPAVGRLIDIHGGHIVMTAGNIAGALGLWGLLAADHPVAYLAVWAFLGIAMAASLYDAAFAALGRIFSIAARRPITALTLIGGFASTVSWPLTHVLIEMGGWHAAYLFHAALLAFCAAPLNFFALPRDSAKAAPQPAAALAVTPSAPLPPHGKVFALVVAAFAAYAFVPSALAAHLLAVFDRAGLDASTVAAIGVLFGPAQVAARLGEFAFAAARHPLFLARAAVLLLLFGFAMLAVFGFSPLVAAGFMLMFGAANGLMTLARGTVPLALFGHAGYGRVLGRIGGPSLLMQAAAPFVLAVIAERGSDAAALAGAAVFAGVAFVCLAAIKPR